MSQDKYKIQSFLILYTFFQKISTLNQKINGIWEDMRAPAEAGEANRCDGYADCRTCKIGRPHTGNE